MQLAEYIRNNTELIISEWESHARHLRPARRLTPRQLRDWAAGMLAAMAEHMERTEPEQAQEPEPGGAAPDLTRTAHAHAMERLSQGFTPNELVSEFGALRATVVRYWTAEIGDGAGRADLEDLVCFDAAVDRTLTESIDRFSTAVQRSRDLFVAALGHDLRNPLAAIFSVSEYLMLTADRLDDQQTKSVVRLRNSALRMRRMIDELLTFARTRLGGALPLSKTSADLGDICARMVEEAEAFHPGCEVRVALAGDLRGRWDAGRLEEAVSNLLSNALKYRQRGTPVTVEARGERAEVVLAIHNEGDPIAPEMQQAIFDPLVRGSVEEGNGRRREGGLGLGLYISQRIAEAHGGSIELRSAAGTGTTFELHLPRDADAEADEAAGHNV